MYTTSYVYRARVVLTYFHDPSNSRSLCSLQSTARVLASLYSDKWPVPTNCSWPTVTTGHPPDWHNHKPGKIDPPPSLHCSICASLCGHLSNSWALVLNLMMSFQRYLSKKTFIKTVIGDRHSCTSKTAEIRPLFGFVTYCFINAVPVG